MPNCLLMKVLAFSRQNESFQMYVTTYSKENCVLNIFLRDFSHDGGQMYIHRKLSLK